MKKLTLAISFTLIAFMGKAQEISEKQTAAFEASYAAETGKEYDKAISALKANYVYNEKSYEINLRLGWLYYEKGDNANSEVFYKLACIINPGSIEALIGYANPVAAAQNWSALFETYQKVLTLDPNHAYVNYRIALMYYYRKDYANAEKHLKKVLNLYPFDFDSLLLMAQTKVVSGKVSEAKSYYLRAQLYSPSNADIKKALEKL